MVSVSDIHRMGPPRSINRLPTQQVSRGSAHGDYFSPPLPRAMPRAFVSAFLASCDRTRPSPFPWRIGLRDAGANVIDPWRGVGTARQTSASVGHIRIIRVLRQHSSRTIETVGYVSKDGDDDSYDVACRCAAPLTCCAVAPPALS